MPKTVYHERKAVKVGRLNAVRSEVRLVRKNVCAIVHIVLHCGQVDSQSAQVKLSLQAKICEKEHPTAPYPAAVRCSNVVNRIAHREHQQDRRLVDVKNVAIERQSSQSDEVARAGACFGLVARLPVTMPSQETVSLCGLAGLYLRYGMTSRHKPQWRDFAPLARVGFFVPKMGERITG